MLERAAQPVVDQDRLVGLVDVPQRLHRRRAHPELDPVAAKAEAGRHERPADVEQDRRGNSRT